MPDLETVSALKKDGVTCVDLRGHSGLLADEFKNWRCAVAKELDIPVVTFAGPSSARLHETASRSETTSDRLTLDSGWAADLDFYTPAALVDLLERENRNALDILVAQLRSPMGVVPFVGAGMSVEFGFPGWPKFLTDSASFHSSPEKVLTEIRKNRLIDAATLLFEENPDRFQLLVLKHFGAAVSEEQIRGKAVSFLPLLASGPVIGTNFDHVLETAFHAANWPFDNIVTGQQVDSVIRAMHRNEHVLIKIHGDAADRSARVFTGVDYDRSYGKAGETSPSSAEPKISNLARIMFTNRPLLFLGASLDRDRTLEVLETIHSETPGLTHYAVLAVPSGVSKVTERRRELDRYGIVPVWYMPGDFGRIGGILDELVQEASTRLIWRPAPDASPRRAGASGSDTGATGMQRPASPGHSRGDATVEPAIRGTARRIARRIAGGRVVFFIGAGAHMNPRMAAKHYFRSLGEDYHFDAEQSARADVAQLMIDLDGKAEAWAAAKQLLLSEPWTRSVVYQFLTGLPSLLRHYEAPFAAQWFLTTNYDTLLEQELDARGERFHLLYYRADGRDEGRFIHRDPDGTVRVIERPRNIRSLKGDAHVVVKLDGGVAWDPQIPETVAISPLDFSISAGRLPGALPEAVRTVLRERSLLVLGSSMQDVHIQRFIRWTTGSRRVNKTWAVMFGVNDSLRRSWGAAGVELIDCDFAKFIPVLSHHVEGFLRPSARGAAG